MEKLKEFMQTIGFGKTEAEVYTALIRLGEATVLEISRNTKLHRPNIYDVLDKLIQEGLVSKVDKPKNIFRVRNPRLVLDYLKRKEISLGDMLKEIDGKYNQKNYSIVGSYQGIFAARQVFFSLLENNKPIYVYGIPKSAHNLLGPIMQEFHRERIKRKILMKCIHNFDDRAEINYLNKKRFTEARAFPKEYNSTVSTNICGDKVIFISWNDNIYIIEIQNNEISKAQEKYFETLWESCAPS